MSAANGVPAPSSAPKSKKKSKRRLASVPPPAPPPSGGLWEGLSRGWKTAVAIGSVLGAILATAGVGWAARVLYDDRASATELAQVEAQVAELHEDVGKLKTGLRLLIEAHGLTMEGL